jgi:flagellar biosynthesis/type III secretory pathway protein FliH
MSISPPIVIDLFELTAIEAYGGNETALVTDDNGMSRLDMEQQELERVKKESSSILAETEQMVMELLQKARDESRGIISNAQEEAEAIKAQAAEEAVQIRQRTLQEAYEEGLRKAHEEIEADRQLAIQQSKEILEEARQTKIRLFRSSETDMVRLVIAIAKKIIAGELQTNPDLIVNVVQEAIDYLDRPENVTVYVNPRDMESVLEEMNKGGLTDIGTNAMKLELKSDDRISAGGCLLESDAGSVDAQLEIRTASVLNAVQEVTADEY